MNVDVGVPVSLFDAGADVAIDLGDFANGDPTFLEDGTPRLIGQNRNAVICEANALVFDVDRNLPLERDFPQSKLMTETLFISALEKTGTEDLVDFDRRPDDGSGCFCSFVSSAFLRSTSR